MRPDLELWLVESRSRRVSFLHEAAARIGLSRVQVLGLRAEELASKEQFAKGASMVTARAVAISDLLLHGIPLLKSTGRLALMQSQKAPVDGLRPVVLGHGMSIADVREYSLGGGEGRRIVVLERA
jgi:16S rRNA G527 N7-methylase RsmG